MKYNSFIIIALLALSSCSTTSLVPPGEYRLASNDIVIEGHEKISTSELSAYVRQQGNNSFLGLNPLLSIYNWSNGSGKGINALWELIGTPPVIFDPDLVSVSAENIREHLRYLGYYDAQVIPHVKTRNRVAKVEYRVIPGTRLRIDDIIFDVPAGDFSNEFYADLGNVTVRVGDYLSEQSLENETVRGASYFRNLGYYNFNKNHYFFEADTLGVRNILHYGIRGYTRNDSPESDAPIVKYNIRSVDISHPADIKFSEKLLRQFNSIVPGEYYSEDVVNKTYYRMSALNLFSGVNIELAPSDSAALDCHIRLSGADQLGFKANLELSSNSSGLLGASPQLTVYHRNIFGGGEWLNLGFTGNWQFMPGSNVHSTEWSASASLSFPKALGYPVRKIKGNYIPRTEIKASYNYQNRPEYMRSIANISYGYTGRIGNRVQYQFYPLQASLVKLYSKSDDFSLTMIENPYLWDTFMDKFDIGSGGTLYYTTDASIVPKAPYSFARVSLDLAGNILSLFNDMLPVDENGRRLALGLPYSQYVRLDLQMGKSFALGKKQKASFALRFSGGMGMGFSNSSALPFEKQFYCGGAGSMRGWQVRSLGPGYDPLEDFFIIPSQTGDMKLELDAELRFPLFWKLEAAIFAEAGNIWRMDEFNGAFPGSIAADWGTGLRINLDFILLRLDAGFKVHDPAREAGQRWLNPSSWVGRGNYAVHFGVGYPF